MKEEEKLRGRRETEPLAPRMKTLVRYKDNNFSSLKFGQGGKKSNSRY